MSAIPLLLQCPQTPTSQSPIHPPLPRRSSHASKLNNRNSFPPDPSQESRWASRLTRVTPARPYGACNPAPVPESAAAPAPAPIHAKTQPIFGQQVAPAALSQAGPAAPTQTPAALRPSTTGTHQPPSATQQSRPFSSRPLVPTVSFNRALTSPTAIKLFNPSRHLNKTQSQLIMPRMKSFFRAGQGSRSAKEKKVSREGSLRSLANYDEATSPEPLIRKCHTVLALSSTSSAATQTKLVKETKGSKLDFLRRMSSSKSAVFHTTKLNIPKSPSAVSDLRRLRKDNSMLFTQTEHEGEGGVCSRCTSTASVASKSYSALAQDTVFCKLCLSDVSIREMYQLQQCLCRFCKYVSVTFLFHSPH